MDPLETKLTDLHKEMTAFFAKAAEEKSQTGRVAEETKNAMVALQKQVDAIDLKLVEQHRTAPEAQKSLVDSLKENEDVTRLIRDRKGHAIINFSGKQISDIMDRKATVTLGNLGSAAPGVVTIERMGPIVGEPRRTLRIRDLLSARPTTASLIYYVKVNQVGILASPVAEGNLKPEAGVTFTTASAAVKTIATWIPASKQALDDFMELEGFLRSALPYYVDREEERQILSGDNTGENLNGLITQATPYNASLLTASAGYTRIDQIGAAIEQIEIADEIEPSFVALNPRDWWNIRRTKDTLGRYILGEPQTQGNPTIWDLTTVPTNGIAAGTFLVGSGESAAAEIRDRMEMQVEISTEHSDYFTRNLIAIRAEKRLALVVLRPGSFVTGTFGSSPVS